MPGRVSSEKSRTFIFICWDSPDSDSGFYIDVAYLFFLFFVQNHPGGMPHVKVIEKKITLMIK